LKERSALDVGAATSDRVSIRAR